MTDPETQYTERVSDIDQRIAAIDVKLAGLEAARRHHAVDCVFGTKSAIQAVAAADAETDKLRREKQTLTTALEQLEQQTLAAIKVGRLSRDSGRYLVGPVQLREQLEMGNITSRPQEFAGGFVDFLLGRGARHPR